MIEEVQHYPQMTQSSTLYVLPDMVIPRPDPYRHIRDIRSMLRPSGLECASPPRALTYQPRPREKRLLELLTNNSQRGDGRTTLQMIIGNEQLDSILSEDPELA